jgi:hypothetical protein
METAKPLVYALCALTALLCAVLMARGYLRNPSRLLLYSALCFAGLALNNILMFADLIVFPESDLSILRHTVALVALAVLIYGFVWELD